MEKDGVDGVVVVLSRGVEKDGVDGVVVVLSRGEEEEVAAVEVAEGVKLDVLEAGLML